MPWNSIISLSNFKLNLQDLENVALALNHYPWTKLFAGITVYCEIENTLDTISKQRQELTKETPHISFRLTKQFELQISSNLETSPSINWDTFFEENILPLYKTINYWRKLLAPIETSSIIPTTYPETTPPSLFKVKKETVSIPSSPNVNTLKTLLYITWAKTLALYLDVDNISFGISMNQRIFPLHVELSSAASIQSLINTIEQQEQNVPIDTEYSLSDISEWLELPADFSYCKTCVLPQSYNIQAVQEHQETHLYLSFKQKDSGQIVINFHYNPAVYSPTEIKKLKKYFSILFEKIISTYSSNPETALQEIDALDAEDRKKIIRWNHTERDFPFKPYHRYVYETARKYPQKTAVVFEADTLTYQELESQSTRLARFILDELKKYIDSPPTIPLFLPRGFEPSIARLAVNKAGKPHASIADDEPIDRLRHKLETCNPQCIITHSSLVNKLKSALPTDINPTILCIDEILSSSNEPQTSEDEFPHITPQDFAFAIFTSGTTGLQKLCMNSHNALSNLIDFLIREENLTPDDRTAGTASTGFDVSIMEELRSLTFGGEYHIATQETINDGAKLAKFYEDHKITVTLFIPSIMQNVLSKVETLNWPHCRLLNLGAEGYDKSLIEQIMNRGHFAPEFILENMCGPTELCILFGANKCTPGEPPSLLPMQNASFLPLDRHGSLVPPGFKSRLAIAGTPVDDNEYFNNNEQNGRAYAPPTAQIKKIPNAGTKIYLTGDNILQAPDTGAIQLLGRSDQQIKRFGIRIEIAEIEKRLTEIPEVQRAIVIFKKADNLLIAYLLPIHANTPLPTPSQIIKTLKEQLTPAAMPSKFYEIQEVPTTVIGKIDKQKLEQQSSNKPLEESVKAIEPVTPLEKTIAKIWQEILVYPNDRKVSLADPYWFGTQTDSLSMAAIRGRLCDEYNIELPQNIVFQVETLQGLIEEVQRTLNETVSRTDSEIRFIKRDPGAEYYYAPVSEQQLGLIYITLGSENDPSYNTDVCYGIDGGLNIKTFKLAYAQILRRHEALRTFFGYDKKTGNYQQIIVPIEKIYDFENGIYLDENYEPEIRETTEAEFKTLVVRKSHQAYDLFSGPLFQCTIFQMSPSQYKIQFRGHHAILDGISYNILFEHFNQYYNQPDIILPPPQLQYADYSQTVSEQSDHIQQEAVDYWEEELKELPSLIPAVITEKNQYEGLHETFILPEALSAFIFDLQSRYKTTRFPILLSFIEIALGHILQKKSYGIGTPLDARLQYAPLRDTVGYCVNPVVIKCDLSNTASVSDLIVKNWEKIWGAIDHEISFQSLVQTVAQSDPNPEYPFFQLMVVQEPFNPNKLQLTGLKVQPHDVRHEYARFPLVIYFQTMADQNAKEILQVTFEYQNSHFNPTLIQQVFEYFKHLIQLIKEDGALAEEPYYTLPLLTSSDESKVTQTWNATDSDFNRTTATTYTQSFETQAQKTPHNTALLWNNTAITYETLNQRSNQLAHFLLNQGAQTGQHIAICTGYSPELWIAQLAAQKIGLTFTPIDPNPEVTSEIRIRDILEDFNPDFLITDNTIDLSKIDPDSRKRTTITVTENSDDTIKISKQPSVNPVVSVDPQSISHRHYTSGSTGKPKGVDISYAALINFMLGLIEVNLIQEHDVTISITTPMFDISRLEQFGPLLAGGSCVINPGRDPYKIILLLEKHDISIIQATPTFFEVLLDLNWQPKIGQKIYVGGEAVTLPFVRKLFGTTKIEDITILYGPTEATIWASWLTITRQQFEETYCQFMNMPIGYPLPNYKIYMLGEHGEFVPPGSIGRMLIGGPSLATRYSNNAILTQEKFIEHSTLGRLYDTGDLGRYLDSGIIAFEGRVDTDDFVKINGYRINPRGIEATLAQHPDVMKALVIPRSDNGPVYLAAYIVPSSISSESKEKLSEEMREKWQTTWDEAAESSETTATENGIPYAGWISGYSDEPMDMSLSIRNTLQRIQACLPNQNITIWDVGCGTGEYGIPLLENLKRNLVAYRGSDISDSSISQFHRAIKENPPDREDISFALNCEEIRSAHHDCRYSLIMANSVFQYLISFEEAEEYSKVMRQYLKPDGSIFLGDIRHPAFQTLLYLDEYLYKQKYLSSTQPIPVKNILRDLHYRKIEETELLLDPVAFIQFVNDDPNCITRFLIKKDTHYPELHNFRYDVVLHFPTDEITPQKVTTVQWDHHKGLSDDLIANPDQPLCIEQIPNGRLIGLQNISNSLQNKEKESISINELIKLKEASATPEPDQFFEFARQHGLEIDIIYNPDNRLNFDAICYKKEHFKQVLAHHKYIQRSLAKRYPKKVSSDPTLPHYYDKIIHELRDKQIPQLTPYEQITPAHIVIIPPEDLPKTDNEKTKGDALFPPKFKPFTDKITPPETEDQKKLAGLIISCLNEQINITDIDVTTQISNLGIKSLSALSLANKIRRFFGVQGSISLLQIKNSTIQELLSFIYQLPKLETPINNRLLEDEEEYEGLHV